VTVAAVNQGLELFATCNIDNLATGDDGELKVMAKNSEGTAISTARLTILGTILSGMLLRFEECVAIFCVCCYRNLILRSNML